MKKILNLLLFLIILAGILGYLFFYKLDIVKKLKSNYFLLFHSNLTIESLKKDNLFPWKIYLQGVSDKYFHIDKIECNLLTKKVEIFNSNFSFDEKKVKTILTDLKYLNIPVKKIEIIALNIKTDSFSLNNSFGKFVIEKSNISFEIFGQINDYFSKIKGEIANFKNVSLNMDFPDFSLKNLMKLLNIPINITKNFQVSSQINYFGNINSKLQTKFKIVFDNNTFIGFLKKDEISANIFNSKIILPNQNEIGFSGQFISPENYKIILQSNDKISGKFGEIDFDNIKFDFLFEKNSEMQQGNLNLIGDYLEIPNSSIFFDNLNFTNINAKLKQLQISNNIIQNVDISTAYLDSKVSFNKLNFDIDDGSFLFSYIPEIDSNPIQIAADIKNIKLDKFLKLLNINTNFTGNLNCSFIAEGKNKKFTNGKGYFFIENFLIYGVDLDNISNEISANNIVNFSFINSNNIDFSNETEHVKFDLVKGFVKPIGNFLKFYKLSMISKKGFLLLKGDLDIKNWNNLILNGMLKLKKSKQNIILNLNFDKKIVQIIKK
jgi:hypothetical protein